MGEVVRFPIERRDADESIALDPKGELVRLPLDDDARVRLLVLACAGELPSNTELTDYAATGVQTPVLTR